MHSEPATTAGQAPASAFDRAIEAIPVAVVASVPAFLRARAAQGSLDDAFGAFALVAVITLLPAALVIVLLRRARDGVRALFGEVSVANLGLAVAAGVVVLAFWERLGAFLAHATHHRGLGGVAFSAGASALALGVALMARRAAPFVEAQGVAVSTFLGVAGLFSPIGFLALGDSTAAAPTDILALFVVDTSSLFVVAFAWVAHLAPSVWPARARALVVAGAGLFVVVAATHAADNGEFSRNSVAFAFRALTLR